MAGRLAFRCPSDSEEAEGSVTAAGHRIDRRRFAGAAGALIASGLFARRTRGAARPQVIVVGAGLSGLQAALLLEEQGLSVQVIEGRNRIGGRLLTLSQVPGRPEAGGNGFGAGYGRVLDAARRYGVEAWDWADRSAAMNRRELVVDDKIVPPAEWPDHPRNPFPARHREEMPWSYYYRFMKANVPLATPADWLDPKFDRFDIAFDDWMLSRGESSASVDLSCNQKWEYNNSTHDVSALVVMFEFLWGRQVYRRDDRSSFFVIRGGNQRLPEAMAGRLRREVHLNREVVALRTHAAGVEAHCSDGSVYRGDRLICSIPFPVLRRLKVEPYFTGVQRQAIWTVPRQMVTQVHIVPKTRFWEADGHLPGMYIVDGLVGFTLPNYGAQDPAELTSLTAWMLGNKAERLDQVDQKSAAAMVVAAIERIRPASKDRLQVAGYKSWFRDPYSSGDWVNFGPGQVRRFAGRMSQPHGRIHFCGDHTALANRGMEAALESAERVALEVLSLS